MGRQIIAAIWKASTLVGHDPDGRAVGMFVDHRLRSAITAATLEEYADIQRYRDRGFVETFLHTKPNPADPLYLRHTLGVLSERRIDADEVVYIGDAAADIDAARKARLYFLLALTGEFRSRRPEGIPANQIIPGAPFARFCVRRFNQTLRRINGDCAA